MRVEIDTKPFFICFDLVLFVLVLYTILHKSKANRKSSPDSKLDGVQTPSHDLNHLPGTWLSRFTALGPLVAFLRFRKAAYIEELFEEYGDVVRISPNQVAFNDVHVLKDVYGFSAKFSKSPWYRIFQINGGDHAFTTVPHAEHNSKRKAAIGFYTIPNLLRFTDRIMNPINQVIPRIFKIRGNKTIEVLGLTRHLVTDMTIGIMMGSDPGAVASWLEGNENKFTKYIGFFARKSVVSGTLPSPIWKMLEMVPIKAVREFVYSDRIVEQLVNPAVTRALDQAKLREAEGAATEVQSNSLLEYLVQHRRSMTDYEVLCELVGHIIAGAETTATLISFILFFISTPFSNQSGEDTPIKSNHSQERLFAELSSLGSPIPSKNTDERIQRPSFRDIDTSPYLEAVVKEGLRLRGSGPAVALRVVPPGKALSIQGNWIPEGTEVGVQLWSMHRKESVWEKPDEFIPERWLPSNLGGWGLDSGSDSYDQMTKHFMPFGVGARVCAGRNMAMIIIKLVVASFVLRFEIKADEKETNAKTMAPRDTHVVSFLSIPR